jgi:hypothetical protein
MTNERKQRILCSLTDDKGVFYYAGPLDGVWGPASQAAAERFLRDFTGEDATDTNVGVKEDAGTFWDEIQYFTRDEMKCKCGGKYCNGYPHEVQPLLMQILQRARNWSGNPIVIISGLRCDTWNEKQGGVANSQHKFGEAVDVYFYGKTPGAALAWLQSQPDVRYAYQIDGSNNIHFDIQPVGR